MSDSLTGYFAQAKGKAFENEIMTLSQLTPGALLIPQFPAVMFTGPHKAKVIDTGWPDFILSYWKTAFFFDAKSTNQKGRFSPNKDKRDEDQFNRLRHAAAYDHFAFYLVEWTLHQQIEVFQVNHDDLWPVSYRYETGHIRLEKTGNWFMNLCKSFLADYLPGNA